MTSRDHLLGHAPAAQFDPPNEFDDLYNEDFPFGVPKRLQGLYAISYEPPQPPTLAQLLPNGTTACTVRDRMGLENRFDIRNARLQALAPPPKVAEQLAMFNEALAVRIDPAVICAEYMTTTIQRNGLVIEQIVKAGAGQAWSD